MPIGSTRHFIFLLLFWDPLIPKGQNTFWLWTTESVACSSESRPRTLQKRLNNCSLSC